MKVKKTLIALAVVASSAVSGNAMAWNVAGTGGKVEFSGTLTSAELEKQLWEVKTGSAVTGLDAEMKEDKSRAIITVKNAVPILSIRPHMSKLFRGRQGISPQIDYHGAIDINEFKYSEVPITLEVTNTRGEKIGKMTANMFAFAESSSLRLNPFIKIIFGKILVALKEGDGFFGGLPKDFNLVDKVSGKKISIDPEVKAKFFSADNPVVDRQGETFTDKRTFFSGYYVSGFKSNSAITITLDSPVEDGEKVEWKASLPVTVSYV